MFLYNCHIAEYDKANRFNHDTSRPRKLLLKSVEIRKIIGKVKLRGYTLIALNMYFNSKNIVKILLGLSKGKKLYDKRQSIKERDLNREQNRTFKP
jgi:SsrA-binding protein